MIAGTDVKAARVPRRRGPSTVRDRDRDRRRRVRRVDAGLDDLLPRHHRPVARPGRAGAVAVGAAVAAVPRSWSASRSTGTGRRRCCQAGNALQARASCLPVRRPGLVGRLGRAASVIGRTAFWGSYSPMVTLISPPGEREMWFGFLGALRNAGFAIGGVVAGVALTLDATSLYYAVALLNAASYVLSLVLLAGVQVDEARRAASARRPGGGGRRLGDRAARPRLPVADRQQLRLRDDVGRAQRRHPRVRRGDARPARLGVGGGVRDQHPDDRRRPGSGRAADDRRGPSRIVALGAVLTAARSWCSGARHRSGVVAASSVVLVAAVVYTLGELVAGPVLDDACGGVAAGSLAGPYIATYQLSWNVATGVAPLLYAWLLDLGAAAPRGWGWWRSRCWAARRRCRCGESLAHAGRVVTNRAEVVAR